MNPVLIFFKSSIGKKTVIAITGVILLLFLIGHLIGNLKIFLGSDSINYYAEFLHSLGALLWIPRIGILLAFVLHIYFIILLTIDNHKANKNSKYSFNKSVKASLASRTMKYSGLVVLWFVIFHLAHFTLLKGPGEVFNSDQYIEQYKDNNIEKNRRDVYKMVIDGFKNKTYTAIYIICIGLLCYHLSHGISSVFQTLGLRSKKTWILLDKGGKIFSLLLFIGYVSIPIAVIFDIIK